MNSTYFSVPEIFFALTDCTTPQKHEESLGRKSRRFGRTYLSWKKRIERQAIDVAQRSRLPLSELDAAGRTVKVIEEMAKLFRTDGTVQKIAPERKEQGFTEIEIFNLLGSSIRTVPLDKNRVLFIQGDTSEQTRNNRATKFARVALRTREAPANEILVIYGNALVMRYEEMKMGLIPALKALMY